MINHLVWLEGILYSKLIILIADHLTLGSQTFKNIADGGNEYIYSDLLIIYSSISRIYMKILIAYQFIGVTENCIRLIYHVFLSLQSTLIISKSKEPSEILRDIRTTTY